MEMREVYSTRVSSIGYDNGNLYVTWARGGKTSVYSGVPSNLADEVMNAASIGAALKMSIEGSYPHSYK